MKSKLYIFFLFALLTATAIAQPGTNDPTFNTWDNSHFASGGFNNVVYALAIQSDGKTIAGGDFSSFEGTSRNRIVRLNSDGSLDTTFNIGTGFNGSVFAIAIQSDNKILVGGSFTSYNGITHNRMVRLNTDGSLDSTFFIGTGFGNEVRAIAIQSDGKIVAGGIFHSFNNISYTRIVRLNSDGSVDNNFIIGTGFNYDLYSIAIQSDGKIIVGGNFTGYNGTGCNRIVRLEANGDRDSSFVIGSGLNAVCYSLAIQPDGKILAGGLFNYYNGVSPGIVRINNDGTKDNSFANSVPSVYSIAIQSDGKIIVGGDFQSGGSLPNRIGRLNANGTLDPTFITGYGLNNIPYALVIQTDGKIIVGGNFNTYNNFYSSRICRLETNGSRDNTFMVQGGFSHEVNTIAIQSDGRIIVGGLFHNYNNEAHGKIIRLNPDGSADSSFNVGIGFSSRVSALAIQSDGKIIVGGSFTHFNGAVQKYLVRLNTDGSIDPSFNIGTGFSHLVYSLAIQSDGKIIVGGMFTSYNGSPYNRIVRLNPDGSIDNSFDIGTGFNLSPRSIVIQSDGKIIAGGLFDLYNGTFCGRIVRINPDGAIDSSFTYNSIKDIYAIKIQSDEKIIVGGGQSYNGLIVRLNPDSSIDTTFNFGTGVNFMIKSIAVQSDEKIILGGSFTSYNGFLTNRLVRLNPDGTVDSSFTIGTGFNAPVNSLGIQSDGKIIVGGEFTSFNGITRRSIARLLVDDCIHSYTYDTIISCDPYTWIDGNTYTSSNNTAFYTYSGGASNGCDSIVFLKLTIVNINNTVTDLSPTFISNENNAMYQWLDCNNNHSIIPGANNQSFIAVANGSYAVEIYKYGCIDTSACFICNAFQTPATIPFVEDFEVWPSDWSVVNGTQHNKWSVGTSTAFNSYQSAYISDTNGLANTYSNNILSVVHMYRDVDFGVSSIPYYLQFNWKSLGEPIENDYLKVYLVPLTVYPVQGAELSSGQIGTAYYNNGLWQTELIELDHAIYAGQTWRLVFSWKNNSGGGNQPPAAIDNISISSCPRPTSLYVSNVNTSSVTLHWTPGGTENNWDVVVLNLLTNDTIISTTVTGNNYLNVVGLDTATAYKYLVQAECMPGNNSVWEGPYIFITSQGTTSLPFIDTFDSKNSGWSFVDGTQSNKWHIGNATSCSGTNSVYVTNNSGVSNEYDILSSSKSHFFRDFEFPITSNDFQLQFMWKGLGEINDYLSVYLVPLSTAPIEGISLNEGMVGFVYYNQPNWTNESIILPSSVYSGGKWRLVFSWVNNSSNGTQPPTAIDDISLAEYVTVGNHEFASHDKSIILYPNPNDGQFIIELVEESNITVINSLGATMHKAFYTAGSHGLDLSYLAGGVYLIKSESRDNVNVLRFVVNGR